jgi:hypothetical protein
MTRVPTPPASCREPVAPADITELDFDDEPTAVNLRQRRDSLFPPSDPDRGEVFSLIERAKRPGLVLVDDAPIDFAELMNAPSDLPPPESPALDAQPGAQPMPSISPMTLPTEPPPAPPKSVVVEKRSRVPYLVTLGALAAAAVAVALWIPGRTTTPQPAAAMTNVPVAATGPTGPATDRAIERHSIDLPEVRIIGSQTAQDTPPSAVHRADYAAPGEAARPADIPPADEPAPATTEAVGTPEAPTAEVLPPVEPPPAPPPPFNRDAASSALSVAASQAASCRTLGTPSTTARVSVTFAPSGRVAAVAVDGAYAGTPTGSCIARSFRAVQVDAFDGPAVTVHRTFQF